MQKEEEKEDFESYSIEEEEESAGRRLTMWSIVPRIMTSPASGWESAKKCGPTPELATIRFFLPICLLSGASEFFSLIYQVNLSFTGLLVAAVISFCSFFIGYYLALVFAKLFLPKDSRDFPSSNYGRLLTMTGVTTLAIFHILFKAIPMFDFIIEFFPLWTIFLLYKGMKLAEINREKSTYDLGVMCVVIICCPVIVEWALSFFV